MLMADGFRRNGALVVISGMRRHGDRADGAEVPLDAALHREWLAALQSLLSAG